MLDVRDVSIFASLRCASMFDGSGSQVRRTRNITSSVGSCHNSKNDLSCFALIPLCSLDFDMVRFLEGCVGSIFGCSL